MKSPFSSAGRLAVGLAVLTVPLTSTVHAQGFVDYRGYLSGEAAGLHSSFDLPPLSTSRFVLPGSPPEAAHVYGTLQIVPHASGVSGDAGLDIRLLTNDSTVARRQGIVPFDRVDEILTRIRPDRAIDFDRLLMFYASNLGRLELGWAAGPSERTAVSGPIDWGMGGYGGDFPYFFRKPQDVGFYSLSAFGSANTSPRLAYYSPRVAGVQGALSFQPDTRDTGFDFEYGGSAPGVIGRQMRDGSREGFTAGFSNVAEAAVNTDNVFGPVRLRASAGIIKGSAIPSQSGGPFSDLFSQQVGLSLSMAGWTVGVGAVFAGRSGYTIHLNPRQRADQFEVNGGLQYELGPWVFGIGGLYGDDAGDPTERSDRQLAVASAGLRYHVSPDWDLGFEVDRIRTLSADFGDYTNYLFAGQLAYNFDAR